MTAANELEKLKAERDRYRDMLEVCQESNDAAAKTIERYREALEKIYGESYPGACQIAYHALNPSPATTANKGET